MPGQLFLHTYSCIEQAVFRAALQGNVRSTGSASATLDHADSHRADDDKHRYFPDRAAAHFWRARCDPAPCTPRLPRERFQCIGDPDIERFGPLLKASVGCQPVGAHVAVGLPGWTRVDASTIG